MKNKIKCLLNHCDFNRNYKTIKATLFFFNLVVYGDLSSCLSAEDIVDDYHSGSICVAKFLCGICLTKSLSRTKLIYI